MTAQDGDRRKALDADLLSNLDALGRDLDDIEALAAATLNDEPSDPTVRGRLADTPTGLSYLELTEYNQQRREGEGWGAPDLTDLLDAAALEQLDQWRSAQRIPWDRSDLIVVGFAGLFGALASLFDTQLDATVLKGLSQLEKTPLIRQWKKDTARLPIDHTGFKFGGPAHRGLSPGHDIGRLFSALNQIRSGTFSGTYWENGVRYTMSLSEPRSGIPFARADDPYTAIALLMKHLATDVVTTMSLPLPGWTHLRDIPNRQLRTFAHKAYAGTNTGDGLNLRTGLLTPGLGMLATEVFIRTHTHLDAYLATGDPRLAPANKAKRNEMLLAAHAAAGAVSVSKTAVTAVTSETALAVRHLNVPVLMRIGRLALQVRSDALDREATGSPSWAALLREEGATWTLPEALTIADLITST
ncbi:hypothetical protein FK529_03075 [Tsukamurella asaccharolytica]|uniref:Uncharacterized protein n=1 Tax=Tsukamurella asaccharolytica TaxID=2592067 RepID=A0A5C5RFX9_9ACTN|nr:hypothetical protein [Tsukamurella asaccharolytica]TWS21582.1 hypothetical protein FK529_03075 [Tsukamurella asaccharolytica]